LKAEGKMSWVLLSKIGINFYIMLEGLHYSGKSHLTLGGQDRTQREREERNGEGVRDPTLGE
jgi:hypothetical protein